MKSHEWCRFREGVTIAGAPAKPSQPSKPKNQKRKSKGSAEEEQWTYVKCGLPFPVKVPFQIEPHMRLTLKFANQEQPPSWPHLSEQQCEALQVEVVDQTAPREEEGYYWGYQVRRATSLSDVHISCPFPPAGYDVSIGTSERGATLDSILPSAIAPKSRTKAPDVELIPDTFEHLLIVFGGVAGLEPAVASDPEFKARGLTKETAHEAFDAWVNLVKGQGSRTIRTEEAVEFGLFGLKGYVDSMYD
jgi:predicted SPOUT superfamily RNA methylase MTH1